MKTSRECGGEYIDEEGKATKNVRQNTVLLPRWANRTKPQYTSHLNSVSRLIILLGTHQTMAWCQNKEGSSHGSTAALSPLSPLSPLPGYRHYRAITAATLLPPPHCHTASRTIPPRLPCCHWWRCANAIAAAVLAPHNHRHRANTALTPPHIRSPNIVPISHIWATIMFTKLSATGWR